MNKKELQDLLKDAEWQVEMAADQGDEEMARYWDTRIKLLKNELGTL